MKVDADIGGNAKVLAAAVDAAGNRYIAGTSNRLQFGGLTLTQIGMQDGFAAKLDPNGTLLWAQNFGGLGATVVPVALVPDGAGGVHLAGHFSGASLSAPALTKLGVQDGLAIKLDAATGATLWAKNFGSSGSTVQLAALAVDGAGSAYLGGSSHGSIPALSLSGIGNTDGIVIKLDAATGAAAWAKNFGGSIGIPGFGAFVYPAALALDGAGAIYVEGNFSGASLTTPALTLIGQQDGFVAKLDTATGATAWAKNIGGGGASVQATALAADGAGGLYLGGVFYDAGLTTPALPIIRERDGFVIKLDAANGAGGWAKNFGGSWAAVSPLVLAMDGAGAVYLAGPFEAPSLPPIGVQDGLVAKLDAGSGATTWAKNFGGAGASVGFSSLMTDSAGGVDLAGYFSGASLTSPALTKIGAQDGLAIKLNASSGATAWAKNFGGAAATAALNALAADSSGAVSLGGYFSNAGLSTPNLTILGKQDGLLVKLDAASGATASASNFGGDAYEGEARVMRAVADSANNKYVAGTITAAAGARIHVGGATLFQLGAQDVFVAKLSPGGTVMWAQNFGGAGATIDLDQLVADSAGGVFLSGSFQGADLSKPALTSLGYKDGWAIKLDAATGATGWARSFGGPGADVDNYGLALDGTGGIVLAGSFYTAGLSAPALPIFGDKDSFAIKLDAATGATAWAKHFGGGGATVQLVTAAADGAGGVYLAGIFYGASPSTPALTKIGAQDALIIKLDAADGATLWATNFGGGGATAEFSALALDGTGGYLAGYFYGAGLSAPPLAPIGTMDGMLIKFDATAGAATWARNFGGAVKPGTWLLPTALAADRAGAVYLGGLFSADLSTPALTKIGGVDGLVIKSDAATGATVWAQNFGDSNAVVRPSGLAAAGGAVYLGGLFQVGGPGAPPPTVIGLSDGFALKLDASNGAARWSQHVGGIGAEVTSVALLVDGTRAVYLGGNFDRAGMTAPALPLTSKIEGFLLTAREGAVISFTSSAPLAAAVGAATYTVTASATSGLPVSLSIDPSASSVCALSGSGSGSSVSFIGSGACVIDADQAGDSTYNAAAQVQQSFSVGRGSQSIDFTSTAPVSATIGGAGYTVTAGASSGLAVALSIDPAAASVCTLSGSSSGSTVSFIGAGDCVVNARQAGNANYNPAPAVSQSFTIAAAGPASITLLTGSAQSATVNSAFGTPITVLVKDQLDHPMPALGVTFAAPASGPSGAFAGSATVLTDAGGVATAPAFTANAVVGAYTVNVIAGSASAAVALTNTARLTYSGPTATGTGTATATLAGGGSSCTFASAGFVAPPPGTALAFPDGLFEFSATGCSGTITLSIVFPSAFTSATRYWKFGPVPPGPLPKPSSWYALGTASNVQLAGSTATFSITDGGLGDDDLSANGTIVDQGGPGAAAPGSGAAPIPTLSFRAMTMLVLILGLAAVVPLRRRSRRNLPDDRPGG